MSTISPGRGLFITFEGGEGAGKTTQLRLLAARLRSRGLPVVETAEPGGTLIGAQIRRVLLDTANQEISAMAELLLVFAARAQNIEQTILPALAAGSVVLCDRFTDSTMAYQGVARGLGADVVRQVEAIACRGLTPGLTIYLDIDPEAGLLRARARNASSGENHETRLDNQSVAFHEKVRSAFLDLARKEPRRIRVVQAARDPETVALEIGSLLAPLLAGR
jgi:dTMP kinase